MRKKTTEEAQAAAPELLSQAEPAALESAALLALDTVFSSDKVQPEKQSIAFMHLEEKIDEKSGKAC